MDHLYPENVTVMEKDSKSDYETGAKSTNNRKSPGLNMDPLGCPEISAEDAEIMEEVSISEATIDFYPRNDKETGTKSTKNCKSPGLKMGPLGYHETSEKDADETAKGNAMVDLYPENAEIMEESNADGDEKILRSKDNGTSK